MIRYFAAHPTAANILMLALIGLGIIATGVPWYLLWNALRRPSVG